jgi:hypothetical protein
MPINEDMRLSDIDALQELLKRERVQLPNLMSLTTRGVPGLDDRTGILWNQLEALRGLSQLRRLFPETVDSIVDMDFFPKHDRKERLMNSARAIRFPSPGHYDSGPVGQLILDMEPNAPLHSTSRYEAKIPVDAYGRVRQHAPQVLADALMSRLARQAPEHYDDMLRAIAPDDVVGRGSFGDQPGLWSGLSSDFMVSRMRPNQLRRRLAALYAPDVTRFSGGPQMNRGFSDAERTGLTQWEEPYSEFKRTDPHRRQPEMLEYTPGHEIFDDFESIARQQGTADAIDRLTGLDNNAYWENKQGLSKIHHRTAPVARNPTNLAIQQLLNGAIGPGEGQMRGSVGVGPVAGIAALAAIPLLAGLLPGGARKYADAALMGGNVAGVPGALVGAGVEGVRDLFD